MKNFFLVLSHYNFIQIKVKTKKSMTLQSFNIRGWKWLSAYLALAKVLVQKEVPQLRTKR